MKSQQNIIELVTRPELYQANLCSLIRGTRIEGRSEEGIETLSKHSFDPYLLSLKKDFLQKDASVVYYGKLWYYFSSRN